MDYKLKLLPIVYQDLRKAKKRYLGINTVLGEDFKLKVNEELDYIQKYPKHYQKRYKELRQAIVARFPYTIYYLIEEEFRIVVVVGILAQKQSFDRIKKRLEK
ncbi:type II toxin-antitoxin system RelE/ParE family toxin [Flavobacterium eburneipallidum]|uniref:type II toxin-antitoxin system RelE/ParE family toxin n=1 Tax=Flavobacterium eburneipallidum TaxID=3003263 RepID=UPI0022AC3500|nr:type II toxin-antitoxin system RelE/ParE family toxin [Flavobacterium eburneipallidum]